MEKNDKINKFKSNFDRFLNSNWFTVLFAVLLLACWYFKQDYAAMIVIFGSIILVATTQKTLEGIIPVLVLFPVFLYNPSYFVDIGKGTIIVIASLAVVTIASLVFHFLFKREKSTGKQVLTGKFTVPFILALIAVTLGGIGYKNHNFMYALYAFGFLFVVLVFYLVMLNGTSGNLKKKIAFSLVAWGVVIIIQVAVVYFQSADLIGLITSKTLSIGWANVNSLAVALASTIPMAVYLSVNNKKFAWAYYFIIIISGLVLISTQSRGVILISAIIIPVSLIYGFIKTNTKLQFGIVFSLMLSVVLVIYFTNDFSFLFNQFEVLGVSNNGRFRDWEFFFNKFKESPIFGVGFFGFDGDFHVNSINKVHNTLLQFLTCTGIVGFLLFLPVMYQKYKLTIYKFSNFKFFVLMNFLIIALYGMIDVTILNGYLHISGIILMIAMERETEEKIKIEIENGKKPRRSFSMYRGFFKRFFDIVLSGIALIVLSPVMAIVAIFVRIKLGGPVVFKQYRPGRNGKIFMFYKFRSMSNERDENGELLPDEIRLTKFGKMLRKTSLDELPQLWNIFKGDMSIIGPRPKLVKDLVFFNEEQNIRSKVRPGLTGYAQANGRNLNTWEETFKYDRYYVENVSFWLDIKILFQTFLKVVKRAEITTQDKTADAYYFGDQLLRTNKITKLEYEKKLKEAKELELAKSKKSS